MELWRAFADEAGPAAMAALWQGAALALGLALCLRLTPRIAAADRFRAWAAGFAALVALPFLPRLVAVVHSFFAPGTAMPAGSLAGAAAPHAWVNHAILNLDPRWSLAIAGVWILASLVRAVDLGVHTWRLRRLWTRAVPIAGAEARVDCTSLFGTAEVVPSYRTDLERIHQAASEGIFGRRVQICTTRDLDRPSVIGFFAPRILIPGWLMERLTPAELEQVILHEAEHLRRRDDWVNLLQKLCLVVFPLNPALAWVERRLCREREIACDEGVVRRTRAPRAYAACLASLAERGLQHRAEALSLGAWQRRPELVDRVHRILRRGPGLPPAAARALLGVVGCGLVFGSVELARCPRVVDFAAQPAAIAPAGLSADALVDGQPLRGFRAVDAVARVHTRAELAEARMAQRRSSIAFRGSRRASAIAAGFAKADNASAPALQAEAAQNDGEGDARSIAVNAGTRPQERASDVALMHAGPDGAQPQQWIVYTEWEQVETSSSAGTAANASETPRVARQFSMTELIFRVYPADATQTGADRIAAAREAQAEPGAASNEFPIAPPAAIPVRDGWLVIQL